MHGKRVADAWQTHGICMANARIAQRQNVGELGVAWASCLAHQAL